MEKGISKSLYIKPNNLKFSRELSKLAEKEGSSFSDAMNEAMQQAYYQKRTGVWISPGAYLAIANGQLEALECVQSRDGGINLMLKREAPALANEGPDSTFSSMEMSTAYTIGEGLLRSVEEP